MTALCLFSFQSSLVQVLFQQAASVCVSQRQRALDLLTTAVFASFLLQGHVQTDPPQSFQWERCTGSVGAPMQTAPDKKPGKKSKNLAQSVCCYPARLCAATNTKTYDTDLITTN